MAFNLSIVPDASEMIARFGSESWSLAILILVMILTAFTIGLYIEALVVIHKHFEFGSRRGYIVIICGLYPVQSVSSLLSICIPTAAFACNFLADIYLAVSLYVILLLITELFGGLDSTVRALSAQPIPLRQPPCCCCLVCLPSVAFNKKLFNIIRMGVLQYMVILLIFALLPAILWVDQLISPNKSSHIYNAIVLPASLITIMSTLVAIFFLGMFGRAARVPLKRFHLLGQFISVQLVLVLVNSQQALFKILTSSGIVVCIPPLTCHPDLVAKTLTNLFIPFEMPLILFINRIVVGRWIRSGTFKEQFDADGKYNVEGDKQHALESFGNRDSEAGAFQNSDVTQMTQDERTSVGV